MTEQNPFRGVLPVLVTPLHEDETVDEVALGRLVRRVVDAGAQGIVVLGSAGEFASLTDDQKAVAISVVVDHVAGRVPVIAGTGEPGTRRAVQATQRAQRLGADGVLVVPPYYYRPSEEAIVQHYRAVAAEGGLPVLLYHIPFFTKVELSLDVVRALAEVPGIVGIKDSGGNLGYLQRLVDTVRSASFTVVTGSDALLFAALVAGGDGCISPGANVVPEWFVALWNAMQAGRWPEAWGLQTRIQALHRGIGQGTFPAGIKGALSLLGIGGRTMAAPTASVTAEQLQSIKSALREARLL